MTHRKSLQEIVALQRQKLPEPKQAFELTAPGEAAWRDLREKSQGLEVTRCSA